MTGWSTKFTAGSWWDVFPPEVSWITGVFTALGGGQFVLVGLNLTMVSDVSAPNTRFVSYRLHGCSPLIKHLAGTGNYTLRSP